MGKRDEGKEKQQTHRKTTPTASNPFCSIFSRLLISCRIISSRQPGEAIIHARRAPIVAVDGEPQPQQTDGHVMYAYRRPNQESGKNSSINRIYSFPGSESLDELNVVGITQNGVVCIVQGSLALNFTLWNPTTGSVLNIPEPDSPNPDALIGASAGFGFDPSSNEYVIIRVLRFRQETNKYPDIAQRFNFQAGRWDWLDNNDHRGMLPFWAMKPTCEVVVNDVPYWKVRGFDLCLSWLEQF
ncbi:hypothetical protein CASFOL_025981 [Castilleja foliolosa]|uniref:Uncharacterized protein n=1 Tax=Castilleja foliolosa TaxID=1961234 RepID=A0ABD3CTM1_9LAMI